MSIGAPYCPLSDTEIDNIHNCADTLGRALHATWPLDRDLYSRLNVAETALKQLITHVRPHGSAPRHAETIERQRQQLFRALAVLHAITLSLTTKTQGFDPDECSTALQVAHELFDEVAAALEGIASLSTT